MRLFKKHKAKDKLVLNVGIKECSTCDKNIRCEECVYQKENENIKSELEMLEIENQSLQVLANSYKLHYNEAGTEAIKEFAEGLKEKLGDCYIVSDGEYCGFDCGDIHRTITNLLKEMAGDTE